MAAIKSTFGSGGANLTPSKSAGSPDLATALRDMADDLAELRTKSIALITQLNADTGVNDVNYVSTLTPAALKTTKV